MILEVLIVAAFHTGLQFHAQHIIAHLKEAARLVIRQLAPHLSNNLVMILWQ